MEFLTIDIDVQTHCTTLRVVGEFDRTTVRSFDSAVAAMNSSHVHVDLSGVTLIDSSAIGSLTRLRRAVHDRNAEFELSVHSAVHEHILRTMGVWEYLGARRIPDTGEPDCG